MRHLDTNIFLRYLVQPVTLLDAQKQQACSVLFQGLRAGWEQATTGEAIIAEILTTSAPLVSTASAIRMPAPGSVP